MTEKLKAYVVCDDHGEGYAVVVFAVSNAPARRSGANELDTEWESVSCRRAQEFDQYAPGPVSPLDLIEHGWWIECTECGRRIDSDEIAEYKLRPVARGDRLYCSPWHWMNWVEYRGREIAYRKEAARIASEHLPAFCTIVRGVRFSEYDPKARRSRRVLGAYFTFPGATHGEGTWSADSPGMVMVPQGDREIYQALKNEEQ